MTEPTAPRLDIVQQDQPQTSALGPVADDWSAIQVWLDVLASRPVSPATLDTYGREVRRLRWYCDTQGAPPPSRWSYQDVLRYGEFLANKAAHNVCPKGVRHGQEGWTPFRKALSLSAVADARKVLNTLYAFLLNAGYMRHNPCGGQGGARRRRGASPSRRALPPHLVSKVIEELEARPKRSVQEHLAYHRDRFAFVLLLKTGIRAHEAVAANMGDIEPRTDPDNGRVYWALRLRTQKGGGEGSAWLDFSVIEELQRYRNAFGLPSMPDANEDLGLILSPRTRASSGGGNARVRRRAGAWQVIRSRQAIYNIVKNLFLATRSRLLSDGDSGSAGLLERASTHWLRHTRSTQLVLSHDIRLVAKVMRHADIRTTMAYTDLEFFDVARTLNR